MDLALDHERLTLMIEHVFPDQKKCAALQEQKLPWHRRIT